jgi:hypothetical protein
MSSGEFPSQQLPTDRWLDWFGAHSPSWLDTLVRCAGIHNFVTSLQFTPFERQFLANGLHFVCTPPPSHYDRFKTQLLADANSGWQRFSRSLTLRLLQPADDADRAPFLAKFTVKTARTSFAEQLEK